MLMPHSLGQIFDDHSISESNIFAIIPPFNVHHTSKPKAAVNPGKMDERGS